MTACTAVTVAFTDAVTGIEPAGHADLDHVLTERADIGDDVDVSSADVRRPAVDMMCDARAHANQPIDAPLGCPAGQVDDLGGDVGDGTVVCVYAMYPARRAFLEFPREHHSPLDVRLQRAADLALP